MNDTRRPLTEEGLAFLAAAEERHRVADARMNSADRARLAAIRKRNKGKTYD